MSSQLHRLHAEEPEENRDEWRGGKRRRRQRRKRRDRGDGEGPRSGRPRPPVDEEDWEEDWDAEDEDA